MNEETFQSQLRRTYQAFKEKPKTRLMVATETDIMRASICRYVAKLRKRDKIAVVKTARDPITRYEAEYLTTDPKLVEKAKPNQLEAFA